MSWSNYLVSNNYKIALEISKIGYDDLDEEVRERIDYLLDYLSDTDPKHRSLDVINYLTKNILVEHSIELMISIFINFYGGEKNWVILPENEVPENYIKIMRDDYV